jgi:dolichyl-phosphate-mannose-protein mannosyltransferase
LTERQSVFRADVVLAAVVSLAAVVRFWGIGFGLPHTWARPDEDAVMVPAVRVVQGFLNPHWFHYPSLYMYLLAPLYAVYFAYLRARTGTATRSDLLAVYFAHPDSFHLLNRWLAATLGVLTVYMVYRTARLFFSRRTALVSALFLALTPLHARDSHFGVTDVPATFMIVVAIYAIAVWSGNPTRRRLALAGACCGLAASMKYNALLAVVPAVLLLVAAAVQDRRRRPALPVDALILIASVGAAFATGTPYAILSPREFAEGLRAVSQHLAEGHGLDLGTGWTYHLTNTLRFGLGAPLLAAGLVGIVWLAIERLRTACLLFSFPIAYYIVAGSTRTVFSRYVIPVIPFLCIGAAYAVDRLSSFVEQRLPGTRHVAALATTAFITLLIALPALDIVRLDRHMARTDSRVLAGAWLRDTIPPGTSIYQSGAFYGHLQFGQTPPYVQTTFDSVTGQFMLDAKPFGRLPEVLIVQASPLMYSRDSPRILELAETQYERLIDFTTHDPALAGANVYDPLDAFYLPLRGFEGVIRPGPNISIYRRRPK